MRSEEAASGKFCRCMNKKIKTYLTYRTTWNIIRFIKHSKHIRNVRKGGIDMRNLTITREDKNMMMCCCCCMSDKKNRAYFSYATDTPEKIDRNAQN